MCSPLQYEPDLHPEMTSRYNPVSIPEMVFFANLGVNLHVCSCGDHQVASAQTLYFLDIGKKSSFPDWKRVYV